MFKKILVITHFLIHLTFTATAFALTLFAVANPAALLSIASSSSILSPTLLSYGLLPTIIAYSYERQLLLSSSIIQELTQHNASPLAKQFIEILRIIPFSILLGLLPFSTNTSVALMIPTLCILITEIRLGHIPMHASKNQHYTTIHRGQELRAYLSIIISGALSACLAPALAPALGMLFPSVFLSYRLFNMNPEDPSPGFRLLQSTNRLAQNTISIFIITRFVNILAPLALSTTPILAPIAPLVAAISGFICSVHPLVFSATMCLTLHSLAFLRMEQKHRTAAPLSVFITSICDLIQQLTRPSGVQTQHTVRTPPSSASESSERILNASTGGPSNKKDDTAHAPTTNLLTVDYRQSASKSKTH